MELVSFLLVSLGRSETLEFVTGRIRQPKALLGQEVDVFGLFLSSSDPAMVVSLNIPST